jgi:hypothetical protein
MACAAEFRSVSELGDHVAAVHDPRAPETDLELDRRLGRYCEMLERTADELEDPAGAGAGVPHESGELLESLRADAAAAIRDRDTERLRELAGELLAIARLMESFASTFGRKSKLARETHALAARVIEMLEES